METPEAVTWAEICKGRAVAAIGNGTGTGTGNGILNSMSIVTPATTTAICGKAAAGIMLLHGRPFLLYHRILHITLGNAGPTEATRVAR